jgi:hypothetical protein
MILYYAHAMPIYRTSAEKRELRQIRFKFPQARIVNPAKYQNHPEKRRDKMGFCLRLVERSDAVVFSRYRGKITAGVGKEANHAIRIGLPVFELKGERLERRRSRVRHLSLEATLQMYYGPFW